MSTPASKASRSGGLASRLVVVGGVLLAVAALLTLLALVRYERGERVRGLSERQELLARVLADHAARSIDTTALAATTLADLLSRGARVDGEAMAAALDQTLVNLPFLRGVALVDARGRVGAGAGVALAGMRVDLAALGPLPEPGHDTVGPFVPGRGLPAPGVAVRGPAGLGLIPYLRTAAAPGGERWFVVALLNPDALATFQALTLNDAHSSAALMGFGGQVLAATVSARTAPGQAQPTLAPFQRFLPATEQATWVGPGLTGDDDVAAFRALRHRPLVVVVAAPRQRVLDEWLSQARWMLALGGAGIAALLAMTVTAARSLRARESARRALDVAQIAVQARERELSLIVGSVRELLFRTDARGAIDFINPRWEAATGQPVTQALGRSLAELVMPESRSGVAALFHADGPAGARLARGMVAGPGGTPRSVEFTVVPLIEGGQVAGFAGSGVDITELLGAQRDLRAQLAFNNALIDSNPLPISVLDLGNRYLRVNPAWEDFTGLSRADVIGTPMRDHLPPDQLRLHETRDRELLARGGEIHYEAPLVHRDGRRRDVFVSKAVMPDAQGRPAGIVMALMDISEFREAERATRRAREASDSATRAQAEFVANISHELRTPLQSILGFSELGRLRGREQPKLAGMFDLIHAAGQRMLALVNDLLDLSKLDSAVGAMALERHDLRDLVTEVVQEVEPLIAARGLKVAPDLSPGALVAKVDPVRFQQVVRNVLANAIRFSPAGGTIEITGEATTDGEGEIHLTLADRGPGIPHAELELIFDAFVQSSKTKDGSGGTGLGLAICRKIMRGHDGRISAANRDGGGSVFRVCLPAARFGDTAPASF